MLTISIDPKPLVGVLGAFESQLPFATAKALNETAVQFQIDERNVMQSEFTIRRPWVLQGVKINRGDFATKSKLEVTVRIDPSRDFLGKFERGGMRTPRGGRALVVPAGVRASKEAVIPANKRPKAFDFHEVGGSRLVTHAKTFNSRIRGRVLQGAVRVYEGNRRTLLIQSANGSGAIFQRLGRGKGVGLKLLYVLRPRTRVPADLHFYETARRSFGQHWQFYMAKWWNESVRTANTGRTIAHGMSLPAGWTE